MFFTLILIVSYIFAGRTGNGYRLQNYYDYDYRDIVVHTNNGYPVQNYYDYDYKNSLVHTNTNDGNFDISDGDIYAGFVKKSYGMSGKIKFNICKKVDTNKGYDCSYPGGEVPILGGKNERPYVNIIPTKIDVTEAVKNAGISKVDNVRFAVTSIENLDGKKQQKEVFHPLRIFRPKHMKDDFYTIFLDHRFIQAPKIRITKNIKLKVQSQYVILFIANNENDYQNCNADKFTCVFSDLYIDPKVYGIEKIDHSNIDCNMWISFQLNAWINKHGLARNFTGLPDFSKWNENGNGNVYGGDGNENNYGNNIDGNINGNNNIRNNNGNNNTRSYYIFDPDGLSKSCLAMEPSRGSVVKIIIE